MDRYTSDVENTVTGGTAPDAPPHKKNRKKAAVIAVAAALAAVGVLVAVIVHHLPSKTGGDPTASLCSFESRAAVRDALKKRLAVQPRSNDRAADDASADDGFVRDGEEAADAAITARAHDSAYCEAAGADEADIVQANGDYIFYLCNNQIDVFAAGEQAQKKASIKPDRADSLSTAGDTVMRGLHVTGNRLTVLCESMRQTDGVTVTGEITTAELYDVSDVSAIRKVGSYSQTGSYLESCMIGDRLYILSDQPIEEETDMPCFSRLPGVASPEEIPYSSIYAAESPKTLAFTVIGSVSVGDEPGDADAIAVIGGAGTVTCNREHGYLTIPQSAAAIDSTPDGTVTEQSADKTQIVKIDLTNGLRIAAAGTVTGLISHPYAIDEYNGNLRVITSSGDGGAMKHLHVLDGSLKELGSVSGFDTDGAVSDTIKAVCFLNDTAYVVTDRLNKDTNSLIVIDVSDPCHPSVTGNAKIDGYPTILVPADDNMLLGIGCSTQLDRDVESRVELENGVKLFLFDVSDKSRPKVLDSKIYLNCESPAQYNPKALPVNARRGGYAISLQHYVDNGSESSGTLLFRVENDEIKVTDRSDWQAFGVIERCVSVDDTIYLLGIKKSRGYDALPETAIDCITE